MWHDKRDVRIVSTNSDPVDGTVQRRNGREVCLLTSVKGVKVMTHQTFSIHVPDTKDGNGHRHFMMYIFQPGVLRMERCQFVWR